MHEFEIIPNEQTPCVPEINDVEVFIKENKDKLDEFLKFASECSNAAGLAANQVSIDGERLMMKVFALRELTTDDGEFQSTDGWGWRLIINPIIEEYIGMKEIKGEGCLTWKGKMVVAERSRAVAVTYYDINGKKFTEGYKGFVAQIWQHEINHLNGVAEQIEEIEYKLPKPLNIGRNDKCPCGSGEKYKNCCLFLTD